MRKIPARPNPHGGTTPAAQPQSGPGVVLGLRSFLIERMALLAVAPLIGLIAGFALFAHTDISITTLIALWLASQRVGSRQVTQ